MSTQVLVVLSILAAYMAVIVGIGLYSARFSRATMEDFHMGGRSFKTFVLFSAVFGANISAVTLAGVPGGAYHAGWVLWLPCGLGFVALLCHQLGLAYTLALLYGGEPFLGPGPEIRLHDSG
jgi:Na+/proline symporter